MRTTFIDSRASESPLSEVQRMLQAIPEKSLQAEFLALPGINIQVVTNATSLVEKIFGVKVGSRIERVEDELLMFIDVPATPEVRDEFEERLGFALDELFKYFPVLSDYAAIGIKSARG